MLVRNEKKAYKHNHYLICLLFCLIQTISSNLGREQSILDTTVNNKKYNLNKTENHFDRNFEGNRIESKNDTFKYNMTLNSIILRSENNTSKCNFK